MPTFRKKPVEIEAVQLCWRNWGQVCDLLGDIISTANPARSVDTYSDTCGEETNADCKWIELTIPTLEGNHVARHGDWIIRGVKGEFYPCKPDIFALTYDAVDPAHRTGGDAIREGVASLEKMQAERAAR
jgi:hypothetical protein